MYSEQTIIVGQDLEIPFLVVKGVASPVHPFTGLGYRFHPVLTRLFLVELSFFLLGR